MLRSRRSFSVWHMVLGPLALASLLTSGQAAEVVGGANPSERPSTLPRITQVQHGPEWYRNALKGVSEPYPRSLYFLDNQGDWYTPFTRRGIPGVYDIRRTHGRAESGAR